MEIKWEQEWDKIYKDQGEVQFNVLPTARVAADVLGKIIVKI